MSKTKPSRAEYVELGLKIRAAREAAGLDQGELAVMCGVKQQSVQQWESGQTAPRLANLQVLASRLNAPQLLVATIAADLHASYVSLGSSSEPVRLPNCIKIQGVLSMDGEGFCRRDEIRQLDGLVPWAGQLPAEAWQIFGDSMEPRYSDGTFVIVSANLQPEAADFVLVELSDGRITIAEFVSQRDGILSLRRIHDKARRSIPLGQVQRVVRVAGTADRREMIQV